MSASDLIHRLPRHLKMGELRVFTAVLEHRSFRKAAAVLHLTQPAVTKAIAGLEDTLGVKLFDRVFNGVEPTVHGRSFAPRATAPIFAAATVRRGTGATRTDCRKPSRRSSMMEIVEKMAVKKTVRLNGIIAIAVCSGD